MGLEETEARIAVEEMSDRKAGASAFDLERFVFAQAPVIERALQEIEAGRKRSHWMWFVFPQLKALGRSPMAQHYGITSLEEAKAYLAHPVLGPRLERCVAAVGESGAADLHALFGSPDDLKFRSSMTLFAAADPDGPYQAALERWCGSFDPLTTACLGAASTA